MERQQESTDFRIWFWAIGASLVMHLSAFSFVTLNAPRDINEQAFSSARVYVQLNARQPKPLDKPSPAEPRGKQLPHALQTRAPAPQVQPQKNNQALSKLVRKHTLVPPVEEAQPQTHGTVFDPRFRKKLSEAQATPDYSKNRQPQLTTFTDIRGNQVIKKGRYCSSFTEGVDETDAGLWSLPFLCDSRPDQSERIKKAVSNALKTYRATAP